MTEFEDISAKLDKLQASLDKGKGWKELIKDVLVPVAGVLLALMGFWANHDANKRQDQQSQSAREVQKLEARAAREQKYLEYFLANYSETSSASKQATAFALLKYMDPQVRKDLVLSLSSNLNLSDEAWRVLLSLGDRLNFSSANAYRVEIYYDYEHKVDAERIKQQLNAAGFEGEVIAEEKIPKFWDNYGWGQGNEIRYEPRADSAAMNYLYRFIDSSNPELKLKRTAVGDTSRPNSVAVHLPPEGGPLK
jgi:hypothetical protein